MRTTFLGLGLVLSVVFSPIATGFELTDLVVAHQNASVVQIVKIDGSVVNTSINKPFGATDGVAFWDGDLYVVMGTAIQRFSGPSAVGVVWYSGLTQPSVIQFDHSGNLLVSETGVGLSSIAPNGTKTLLYAHALPLGIGVRPDGHIYLTIADSFGAGGTSSVVHLSPEGSLLDTWLTGTGFGVSAGIAFDDELNAYLSDHYNGRLWKMTPTGVGSILLTGLNFPEGVATGPDSWVYVGCNNAQVLRFSPADPLGTLAVFAVTSQDVDMITFAASGPPDDDTDDDGYADSEDCFAQLGHLDPLIYPDAPEVCDGKDNDCDGFVDEDLAPNFPMSSVYVSVHGTAVLRRVTFAGAVSNTGVPVATGLSTGVAFDGCAILVTDPVGGTLKAYGSVLGEHPQTLMTGLNTPIEVAVGPDGRRFVAAYGTNQVWVQPPAGTASVFAVVTRPIAIAFTQDNTVLVMEGSLQASPGTAKIHRYMQDGFYLGTLAQGLHHPSDMVVDALGNVFVTEHLLNQVHKYTPLGQSSVFGSVDSSPEGIALDTVGNFYVALNNGKIIRGQLDSPGVIQTLANVAADAERLAVPGVGTLWSSDLDEDGVNNDADCPSIGGATDPSIYPGATEVCDGKDNDCDGTIDTGLDNPDVDGFLYATHQNASYVDKIGVGGAVTVTDLYKPQYGVSDGIAASGCFVYLSQWGTGRILRKANGLDGNFSIFAQGFTTPYDIEFAANGDLMVADGGAGKIWRITPAGVVTSFVTLTHPVGLDAGADGFLYATHFISGSGATAVGRLVKINPLGGVTILASGLSSPVDVVVDSQGNAFVSEHHAFRISKVTPGGQLSTAVTLDSYPEGLEIDSQDRIYVGNNSGQIIRFPASDPTNTTVFATTGDDVDRLVLVGEFTGGDSDNDGVPDEEDCFAIDGHLDAAIYPGAVEICDGKDNDCDGEIDTTMLCDDANPCTDDICGGVLGCSFVVVPDNVVCDDGDACTKIDRCIGGVCDADPLFKTGDVNLDQKVNVSDAQCAILTAVAILSGAPDPICLKVPFPAVDLDCDDVISVSDITLILYSAVGLPFPAQIDSDSNGCADFCQ
ncbi:MAG: hypothetical protein HUU55_13940 [Myxococcales bacterium]|nr:hypothetical protein [Myxococcales bacterium]